MLLNLGGPETLDDVQPFLYNLFADPDIIRLPEALKFLQKPLATVISMTRASKSAEGYKAIGGGSPLRRITEEQGRALKQALDRKGTDAEVYVAMRYWHPYTEEAMNQVCLHALCPGDKRVRRVMAGVDERRWNHESRCVAPLPAVFHLHERLQSTVTTGSTRKRPGAYRAEAHGMSLRCCRIR